MRHEGSQESGPTFIEFTRHQFEEIFSETRDAYMALEASELMYLRGVIKKPSVEKVQKFADRYWREKTGEDIDASVRADGFEDLTGDRQASNYAFMWLKQLLREAALIDRTK